jgi:hypothetical protein
MTLWSAHKKYKNGWKVKRYRKLFLCKWSLNDDLEQLQQFGKSTWHPFNFGKTRKIGLQQFGKPTW